MTFRFSNRARFMVQCLLCSSLLMGESRAATVILKGKDKPLHGYLVTESASGVVLGVRGADGTMKNQFISRAEIDILHKPLDPERLSKLRPDQPRDYRDYAEELAEKRVDPEALEGSLRLYLIAAYLEPQELGKSSLLGMTALARSNEESRRFRALAYLLDPSHDRSLLTASTIEAPPKKEEPKDAASASTTTLLKALELLRKGRNYDANQQVRKAGVEQLFAPHEEILSYKEFLDACADKARRGPPASPKLSAKILQLELTLLGATAPPVTIPTRDKSDQPPPSWSSLDKAALAKTATHLSLETVTELDPRKCVFRNGEWVEP